MDSLDAARWRVIALAGPIITSAATFRVLVYMLSQVDAAEWSRRAVLLAWPSITETSRATGIARTNVAEARAKLCSLTLMDKVATSGNSGIASFVIYRINRELRCSVPRNQPLKRHPPQTAKDMAAARHKQEQRRNARILDVLDGHVAELTRDLQEAEQS